MPTDAGTWYVKAVIDGTDDYEGAESEVVSFVIKPKDAAAGTSQIKVPDLTADTDLEDLTLKNGDKVLVQGTDYKVTKTQDGETVTVTITYKGNYSGTMTKTYTVKETSKSNAAKTGDIVNTGLWAALLAFSDGVVALLTLPPKSFTQFLVFHHQFL